MADEPENLTLRLLREMREESRQMREENLRLHAETRAEVGRQLAEMRAENGHWHAENERQHAEMQAENARQHAETRAEFTLVLETAVDMAKVVNKTADAVAVLNGRMERVEKRLDAIEHRTLN